MAEDGFKENMVAAVEVVMGAPIHPENIIVRPSSKGKYISVQISVIVKTPQQVLNYIIASADVVDEGADDVSTSALAHSDYHDGEKDNNEFDIDDDRSDNADEDDGNDDDNKDDYDE